MPYALSAPFNGRTLLQNAPGLRRCETCQMPLNKWEVKGDLCDLPYKSPPLSLTIDGFYVASRSFQTRYHDAGWTGLRFRPISRGYAEVRAQRVVRILVRDLYLQDRHGNHAEDGAFASLRRTPGVMLNHSGLCNSCGVYLHVRGGGDVVIAADEAPIGPAEFVAADYLVGDRDTRHACLIVGNGVREAHKAHKIRGASIQRKTFCEIDLPDPPAAPTSAEILNFAERHPGR